MPIAIKGCLKSSTRSTLVVEKSSLNPSMFVPEAGQSNKLRKKRQLFLFISQGRFPRTLSGPQEAVSLFDEVVCPSAREATVVRQLLDFSDQSAMCP